MANWKFIGDGNCTHAGVTYRVQAYIDTTGSLTVGELKITDIRFINGQRGKMYAPLRKASLEFNALINDTVETIQGAGDFKVRIDLEINNSRAFTGYYVDRFSDYKYYESNPSVTIFAISSFEALKSKELSVTDATTNRTLLEHLRYFANWTDLPADCNVVFDLLEESSDPSGGLYSDKIRFRLQRFEWVERSAYEVLVDMMKAFVCEMFFADEEYHVVRRSAFLGTGGTVTVDKISFSSGAKTSFSLDTTGSISLIKRPNETEKTRIAKVSSGKYLFPFRQALDNDTDLHNTNFINNYNSFSNVDADWELIGDCDYYTVPPPDGETTLRIQTKTTASNNYATQKVVALYEEGDSVSMDLDIRTFVDAGGTGPTKTLEAANLIVTDLRSGEVATETLSHDFIGSAGAQIDATLSYSHEFGDSVYSLTVELIYSGDGADVTTLIQHRDIVFTHTKNNREFTQVSSASSQSAGGDPMEVTSPIESYNYHAQGFTVFLQSLEDGAGWITAKDFGSGRSLQEANARDMTRMFASSRNGIKGYLSPTTEVQMNNTASIPDVASLCMMIYQELQIRSRSFSHLVEMYEVDDDAIDESDYYTA